jgi:hypothetical protein
VPFRGAAGTTGPNGSQSTLALLPAFVAVTVAEIFAPTSAVTVV